MTKFKNLSLLLFFVLVSSSSLLGQTDYKNGFIITLENDTIKGEIKNQSSLKNYKSCIIGRGGHQVEYLPNQILGFGYYDDKFFSSQIITNSFVEVLVSGKLSLFKSAQGLIIDKENNQYLLEQKKYITSSDGQNKVVKDNRWKGVLATIINDCLSDVEDKVHNSVLSQRKIINLIIEYNKCAAADYIEYNNSKPWTKFNFGVSVSTIQSKVEIVKRKTINRFDYDKYYLADSYSSNDYSIGVLSNISSPRISERLSFETEIQFIKSNFSGFVYLDQGDIQYHYTDIQLTTLSIPLSIKYAIPIQGFVPFLQCGFNYDNHINRESKHFGERVVKNVSYTIPEEEAFEITQSQVGLWGGVGLSKSLKIVNVGLSIRYFQMKYLNEKQTGFTANNSRMSITAIITTK